jgi:hypothetical protein
MPPVSASMSDKIITTGPTANAVSAEGVNALTDRPMVDAAVACSAAVPISAVLRKVVGRFVGARGLSGRHCQCCSDDVDDQAAEEAFWGMPRVRIVTP